ncbi:Calx-beta domain-containing protein [Stieleria mannarensis]|uniref:Calx-beta domain-containing protein n=1 Tax=Stieleria mannarensis TaxID=2755585 RepID=UPI0016025E79
MSTEFASGEGRFEELVDSTIDSSGRTVAVSSGGALVRYDVDGSIDTTFGDQGVARLPIFGRAVDLQSDGKVVVSGDRFDGAILRVAVTRFLGDGTLDSTFGDSGVATAQFDTNSVAASEMAIQSNDRIVVVGSLRDTSNTIRDIAVARFLPDGDLDTSFSGDGKVTTDVAGVDFAQDVALAPSGKIVVGGYSGPFDAEDFTVVRYNTDGSLDTSFSVDGKQTIDIASFGDRSGGVAVQGDEKIVVAGEARTSSFGDALEFAVVRLNTDGSLDSSFDSDGIVTTDFLFDNDSADDVTIDDAGRIIAVGTARTAGSFSQTQVAVARYLSNGVLDTTFDGDGKATFDFEGNDENANRVTLQGDGKIVIAGSAVPDFASFNAHDLALMRVNPSGSLDSTFDTDGWVTTSLDYSQDEGQAVAVGDDGKIVVAGRSQGETWDFAVSRHLPDGSLDPSFGGDGTVTTAVSSGGIDEAQSVAIAADGRITVGGRSGSFSDWDFSLVRYNVDGTLDTSFNGTGKRIIEFGTSDDSGFDLALQADGKAILVGGVRPGGGYDFGLTRINADGSPDFSFDGDSLLTTDFAGGDDIAYAVQVLDDGKILTAGYATVSGNVDFALVRYNADGSLDTTFGSGGQVAVDFGLSSDFGQELTLQPDGKILVAGGIADASGFDFGLARFHADGSLDTSFGSGGWVRTDFDGFNDVAQGVAVQSDGKIVVAGYVNNGVNFDFGLARYNADGTLDGSFGDGGLQRTAVGASDDILGDLVLQSNDDILVAGRALTPGGDAIVARYQAGVEAANVTVDGDSNLLITGNEQDDRRRIESVGTDIVITDQDRVLTTNIPGASGSGTNTVAVPKASFTAGIVIDAGGGADTLVVDLDAGNFDREIRFNGDAGNDDLVLQGGSFSDATYNFASASDGSISIAGNETITYTGLEPIVSTISAANVNLNYLGGSETIELSDSGSGDNLVTSSAGESLRFVSPGTRLTIDSGDGDDVIRVLGTEAGFRAGLSIVGGTGVDTVSVMSPVTTSGDSVSIDADGISLSAAITTSGGDVSLQSSGDISIADRIATGGGRFEAHADSDADGVGEFRLLQGSQAVFGGGQSLLPPPTLGFNDQFGLSVAMDENTAVVGAPFDDDGGGDSGAVYVYTRASSGWAFQQKLIASDSSNGDQLGREVAIDGDTIVVSAFKNDAAGIDAGALYVFTRQSGIWTEQQKLTVSNAVAGDHFPASVAISGDRLIAGVGSKDDNGTDTGMAYLFTRTSGVWSESRVFVAPAPDPSDGFGNEVDIDGNTLAISAAGDDDLATNSGAVYVYVHDGTDWGLQQKLTAADPSATPNFGRAISIDGDRLAIGAATDDTPSSNSGSAYVFSRSGTTWTQDQKLVPSDSSLNAEFGRSVALSGTTLVVGAHYDREIDYRAGAAYVFTSSQGIWSEQEKLLAEDGASEDQFGRDVAFSGDALMVGAFGNDDHGTDSGSVYLFQQSAPVEGGQIASETGDVAITAASVVLEGAVSGTATLSISPSTPGANVGLGGAAGDFNLDDAELGNLIDGFNSIQIGAADSGVINLQSVTVNDHLTITGSTVNDAPIGTDVDAPSLTLQASVQPGQSPGVLTVNGDVSVENDRSVVLEFGGSSPAATSSGHDQIDASGRVDLGNNIGLSLAAVNGYVPSGFHEFVIIRRSGGAGTFAGLPEGSTINDFLGAPGVDATISYLGGDGDDIVLTIGTPTIALSVEPAAFAETAGANAAVLTISRNTDTTDALTVNLSSSDTSEAAVPATVTIPAGQISQTVSITAIDDQIVDGTQSVTITADAPGFASANIGVSVTDNEQAAVLVSPFAGLATSEGGGTAEFSVVLSSAPSADVSFRLVSSDSTEGTISTGLITFTPENWNIAQFVEIVGQDDAIVDGDVDYTIITGNTVSDDPNYSGINPTDVLVTNVDNDVLALSLEVDSPIISEDGGTTTGTVTRNDGDLSNPLVVTLASNDTTEATVPATITIDANATSATFTITGVDDAIVDGTQTATITATAGGYTAADASVDVTDDDALSLTLTIDPASISEDGGTATGTVTRNDADLSNPLVVTLASNDTSEATVPATITIDANATSATFTIAGVDDTIVDGTQVATITATATGYTAADASIDVTDDDALALTLTIDPSSISEDGGTATGTVTRNDGDLSNPLVVTLASNDTTEATAPATITIDANATSATFTITGVDDAIVDGTQTATITATAGGYTAADASVDVTDDDALSLTLTINPSSISEDGGTATGTATRNDDDLSSPLTVTLASNDTSEATVPATITIDANATSATFTIAGVDDTIVDGTQVATITATATGYTAADASVDVTDDDALSLTLTIDPASISEDGGTATGTVTRNDGDLSNPLVVTLASNDTTEATAPATITIDANATSATFTIIGVDDAIVDGTQTATITATAGGYTAADASVDVTDDDALSLTLTIDPSSISEDGGTATGTVTRNDGDLSNPLVVTLASNNTTEATAPATITIDANTTSATFTITGVDDAIVDGTQTATITATAGGYTSADASVDVTDDDALSLTLTIDPASISEDGGTATGTVTRNDGDLSNPLVVTLASNDTTEATAPATITIDANTTSATFTITGVDDAIVDGTQTATITATAGGYTAADASVDVTDDDALSLTLTIDPASISEEGGTATGTVTRNDGDLSNPLVVTLASNDTTEATAPATITIDANATSATFTITGVDDAIVDGTQTATITATAGGYTSADASVDVTDDEEDANSAPEILTIGVSNGADGQAAFGEITLAGLYQDRDVDDTHSVLVDWGDGQSGALPDESVDQDADSFETVHVYDRSGVFVVTVSVVDLSGAADTESITSYVAGVRVTDEGILEIIGTDGNDRVNLTQNNGRRSSGSYQLRAKLDLGNDQLRYDMELVDLQGVFVVLLAGDDRVKIGTHVELDTTVYAGDGKDVIHTGAGNDSVFGDAGDDVLHTNRGNDVVVGGLGDDLLDGGLDHNLLIGGQGADMLHVRNDRLSDLLIAGATVHDTDLASLRQILDQSWTARIDDGDPLEEIVEDLAGSLLRPGVDVVGDESIDHVNTRNKSSDAIFATIAANESEPDDVEHGKDDLLIDIGPTR